MVKVDELKRAKLVGKAKRIVITPLQAQVIGSEVRRDQRNNPTDDEAVMIREVEAEFRAQSTRIPS